MQANIKFHQCLPVLSAAIHLSLSDTKRALHKLLFSNNLEYAFVVSNCFHAQSLDYILTLLSSKSLEAASADLARQFAQKI